MATATRRRKSAPVEPEVVDEDAFEELADDDLEELEDEAPADEEIEEAPAPKRGRKPAARTVSHTGKSVRAWTESSEYNSAWLAEHVSEVTGETIDSRSLRMLLRKMAKNEELDRVVGEDRARYTFPKGPNDPIVKAVIRKVKSGELKTAKREGLENVKKKAPAKKAAAPVEDEAPAPRRRSGAAKATKAAPAKAQPAKKATRRTRSTSATTAE